MEGRLAEKGIGVFRACGRGLIESAEPANLVQLERKEKHNMWMTKGSNVTQRAWE